MATFRLRGLPRLAAAALLASSLASCAPHPVEWTGTSVLHAGLTTPGHQLLLAPAGRPRLAPAERVPFTPPAAACNGSLVFSRVGDSEAYAAWWMPRADSSTALMVARSTNGGESWSTPVDVDARDASAVGCNRPPPAIAADSVTGYVHLAYFARPPAGSGIWFVHSMDHGATWHSLAGLAYGTGAGGASVAALGDTVVVAYEMPEAGAHPIALAISRTAGHVFEQREDVSGREMSASAPLVALAAGRVAVAWTSRAAGADSSAPAAALVRWGRLEPAGG